MKPALTYIASIIGFAIGSVASTALAQTTANGPYYATPSWDQTLPVATRFIVLSNMSSDAVLDRETGLVWEKTPSTNVYIWRSAQSHCGELVVGNRQGWRVPTAQELLTLADPSTGTDVLSLPTGHPFAISDYQFWSSSPSDTFADTAYSVSLRVTPEPHFSNPHPVFTPKDIQLPVWCVRGGQGVFSPLA